MALPYKSIAVESNIDFVNLQPLDINPLMSKCDIKVFYLGKNRNNSYITKEVAAEMAKTLRGCPIVGYFKESKDDFVDHGEQVILDDEGIHFKTLTKPYGFVSPDAQVWFQDFEDEDGFGNIITRTYLCTTGYLWTGQYKEANKIYEDGGKPHSMELDKKSLQGVWSEDIKDNVEFFIISDGIFSKLCILGDDVEPCYEGSSITEASTNTNFTLDKTYKQTLYTMMQELKNVLKGEHKMPTDKDINTESQLNEDAAPATNFSAEQGNFNKSSSVENENNVEGTKEDRVTPETDFKKDDKDKKSEQEEEKQSEVELEENTDDEDKDDDDKKKSSGKFALEDQYEILQANFAQMKKDYEALKVNFDSLVQFKQTIEDKKKDELIAKFFMLSDEDKKDVIDNKSKYTLEEIKQKLAVIGFEKGVNFNLTKEQEKEKNLNENIVTFNLNAVGANNDSLPDWVQAVKDTEKQF